VPSFAALTSVVHLPTSKIIDGGDREADYGGDREADYGES